MHKLVIAGAVLAALLAVNRQASKPKPMLPVQKPSCGCTR